MSFKAYIFDNKASLYWNLDGGIRPFHFRKNPEQQNSDNVHSKFSNLNL